jgi:phage gpG-like protein
MSFSGSHKMLKDLQRRFEILRGPQTRARLAKVMGQTAHKLAMDGFRKSVDPYGEPWKPLAQDRARNGRGTSKPLLDTGRLRKSFAVTSGPDGFNLWTKTKYAPFHQRGTGGRSRDQVRFQPVSKRGRFVSRSKVGKTAKRPRKGAATRVRTVQFSAGSGKIPPRMMVPSRERGLGTWKPHLQIAAHRFMLRIMQRLA